MAELIIEKDNNKCKYNFVKYSISVIDDELEVVLQTSGEVIKYNINSDIRHPDITYIADFIQKKINNSVNNISPLVISEYPIRHYIYFGNIDVEDMEEFTGIRV